MFPVPIVPVLEKESDMLKLTMRPGDYLTISDNIVVQIANADRGRAEIAVHAPPEVLILRGAALERSGGQRPDCLDPPGRKKNRRLYTRVPRKSQR